MLGEYIMSPVISGKLAANCLVLGKYFMYLNYLKC